MVDLKSKYQCHTEVARIYRAINRLDDTNDAAKDVVEVEDKMRKIVAKKAAATKG